MTKVIQEEYVVTEDNLLEIVEMVNNFCKGGFKKTHDWLRFTDKPDKTFEQLTFEKDYPVYKFDSKDYWKIGEYINKPAIVLEQDKEDNYSPTIKIGHKIRFTKNAIYYIDTEETCWQFKWQQCVGKIFK